MWEIEGAEIFVGFRAPNQIYYMTNVIWHELNENDYADMVRMQRESRHEKFPNYIYMIYWGSSSSAGSE